MLKNFLLLIKSLMLKIWLKTKSYSTISYKTKMIQILSKKSVKSKNPKSASLNVCKKIKSQDLIRSIKVFSVRWIDLTLLEKCGWFFLLWKMNKFLFFLRSSSKWIERLSWYFGVNPVKLAIAVVNILTRDQGRWPHSSMPLWI